jgi:hypothetical protein
MRVPSRLEDDGVWANVIRQAKGPLCALRFTDPAQLGGPRVQLNGDYRAILQHDMSLVGLWYPNETALEPIGTFALHSDRPR